MIEQIYNLLEINTLITMVAGMVLMTIILWLYERKVKNYIKNKYNLFSSHEVQMALNHAQTSKKQMELYLGNSQADPSFNEKVMIALLNSERFYKHEQ